MNTNTFETIKRILVEKAGKNAEDIRPDTALDDLDVDSLDFIEFVFFIEDEFKIRINVNFNDVATRLKTVGDVVLVVDECVATQVQPAALKAVAV
ncbi:phosphopantetheine-binding protein [Rhizobium sp. NFR03]|uniref:phosphopantetheine-binding protein n=1 Tax=Rhizobium sp. NFR03 TaxID=1566263 RepID=UPI0008B08E18|nr:phosphopantetheine-binding protein [Rhizobium sp. NFR03]SES25884.1 acyl carrier protein [Rhizobium sp. NFR03]